MLDAYAMMRNSLITEAEDGIMIDDDELTMSLFSNGESDKCCEDNIDDDVEDIVDDDDDEQED